MKKNLFFILCILFVSSFYAQVNVTVDAPAGNSVTQRVGPNNLKGSKHMKSCFLITTAELSALTGSIVNAIGFSLMKGASVAFSGSLTVYLQNTTDNTYGKSTDFSVATSNMVSHYTGSYSPPVSNSQQSVTLPCSTNFTYTGGGIYVALDWVTNGPFTYSILESVVYDARSALAGLSRVIYDSLALPSPAIMGTSNYRPTILFRAVNTATNDLTVRNLRAAGKIAVLANSPQIITVDVKNASNVSKTAVSVTLNINGANSFTDVVTIPLLAPDAVATVSFATYNPQALGLSAVVVKIGTDDNVSNNQLNLSQSATCSEFSEHPPVSGGSFNGSWGGIPVIFAIKQQPAINATLAAVRMAMSTNTTSVGNKIFPVLTDVTGNIVASGNTLTITNALLGNFVNLTFPQPITVSAGSTYYIGVAVPGSSYFPVGGFAPLSTPFGNYALPPTGGLPVPYNSSHLGIGALFNFASTVIAVSASKTVMCLGESVELVATGALPTYSWSEADSPTTNVFVVIPTEVGNPNYNVYAVHQTGCRSNFANITIKVNACTNLADENLFKKLMIFPNPAHESLTLKNFEGTNKVEIFNMIGEKVFADFLIEHSKINIANLNDGSYILKVTSERQESQVIKFVVSH